MIHSSSDPTAIAIDRMLWETENRVSDAKEKIYSNPIAANYIWKTSL
jgi:hypothetical protein